MSETTSVASVFLAEIRDVEIQQDRLRFRKNMARLGEILAYEMSKSLEFNSVQVTTPLSVISQPNLNEQPVLISIMRAGLAFFEGIQSYFDRADCGFVGAYRAPDFDTTKVIETKYIAVPDLTNKTLVLADPMLATGKSAVTTMEHLRQYGIPKRIYMLSVIATSVGIDWIEKNIKLPITLWTIAIDEKLNDKSYIVPGLGDAGDLAYGPKK